MVTDPRDSCCKRPNCEPSLSPTQAPIPGHPTNSVPGLIPNLQPVPTPTAIQGIFEGTGVGMSGQGSKSLDFAYTLSDTLTNKYTYSLNNVHQLHHYTIREHDLMSPFHRKPFKWDSLCIGYQGK